MSMTDPVADFLTRIRNAIKAAHAETEMPVSTLKVELARILREQGYIDSYESDERNIRVKLKYTEDRRSAITGLKRVSRPGQRHYAPAGGIRKVQGGMGTAIVSTSQGVMTGHDARRAGVGGEVMAEVW